MELRNVRFGNYFEMHGKCSRFRFQDLDFHLDRKTGLLLSVNPIPLTEEWLIKLGFEKHALGNWEKGKIEISGSFKYCWFASEQGRLENISSVHKLQNLYFALTDKELIINKE